MRMENVICVFAPGSVESTWISVKHQSATDCFYCQFLIGKNWTIQWIVAYQDGWPMVCLISISDAQTVGSTHALFANWTHTHTQ